ncbi:cryptochrome/photolyase family protein [Tenacibaculum tangerinum]|uniref:Cryptochrome/photolyase family protein n=1 Tax=Tenacibaculum tangerinum TaxID=3038772 RepID=A0ABY8KYG2_9FLAO|nr:cryptochrome/photolyase family protein [Tenacibaculum tangerinum]WGH74274.1 cryptochrome/photolyase family protein [Tenacibaculum tangerinum]
MSKTLRIILGDQLNIEHSWYKETDDNTVYALFEMKQETSYVKHHIQKVVGFFLAMRNFANALREQGHRVAYMKISDKKNKHQLIENIEQLVKEHHITAIHYQEPDEFRLDAQLQKGLKKIGLPLKVYTTEHFYTTRNELEKFSKDRKKTVMEDFYRYMRKKHQILVEGDKPVGGQWNYDKNNRKKWNAEVLIPLPYEPRNNCKQILQEIKEAGITTFGERTAVFNYPISRKQAKAQLDYFCKELLPFFGDYQDAMHTSQDFLFHSKLSFAMNTKLISPKEVVEAVENEFYKSSNIDISQAEGFIRQVIGWREYMRGIYWQLGVDFKQENFFKNKADLPNFFWTGDTKMNCVKRAIQNSLQNAYAHHIQRLMILGNVALLLGVAPDKVDAWYLGVYVDAIEWVQLPNTRGMSQFADGGLIATKPYVSSASYIHKMSNYCSSCFYNHKTKTNEDSCPLNTLYWDFLHRNKEVLKNNHRMRMMYSLLNKMESKQKEFHEILEKAKKIKEAPDYC